MQFVPLIIETKQPLNPIRDAYSSYTFENKRKNVYTYISHKFLINLSLDVFLSDEFVESNRRHRFTIQDKIARRVKSVTIVPRQINTSEKTFKVLIFVSFLFFHFDVLFSKFSSNN